MHCDKAKPDFLACSYGISTCSTHWLMTRGPQDSGVHFSVYMKISDKYCTLSDLSRMIYSAGNYIKVNETFLKSVVGTYST